MKRLLQLRKKRADLVREANEALNTAIARAQAAEGDEGLTDEEQAQQDAYTAQIKKQDALIQAEELRIEREATLTPAHPDAGPVDTPDPEIEVGSPNVAADPFRGFRLPGDEFDMAGFAMAVRAACRAGGAIDTRLIEGGLMAPGGLRAAPTNVHQEANQPEGAMVPPAVSTTIWGIVFDDPLLGLIPIEPTSSNIVEFPADETTPWGAAGILAKWRAESEQMTPSKLVTDPRQVRLHELYAFALVTDEMAEDAPRLANRLNTKAPEAIRWKLVESFMFGTGSGQPLGWASDNYAGKVSATRATSNQINAADLLGMYSRLLVGDGPDRSFWVGNRVTLQELVTRSVVGNVPVWMPPSGLAGAPNGTILGRPLFFSEHCSALGSAGDLQYINPAGYYATQRSGLKADSSIHLYYDYGLRAFRWMVRFGGTPLLKAAVTPPKATTSTKSHSVILAA